MSKQNLQEPSQLMVTMFPSLQQKSSPHYTTLATVVERIKSPSKKITELVLQLREGNQLTQKEFRAVKEQLPIVCFSGKFETRKDSDIIDHSGLIVIDFDDLDPDDAKSFIATDDYTLLCFVSPSNRGLKVVVRVSNPERHRDHFRALSAYYSKEYGLIADPTGINESRACFESLDPDVVYNESAKVFGHMISELAESQVATSTRANFTDYEQLNIAARMIRGAQDGEKHSTLLKASVLCGGYVAVNKMEEDEVVRILMREIVKKDIDSESVAMNTIRDGIEKGKTMPINEIMTERERAVRGMKVLDGDMSFISSDDDDFRWINDFADGKILQGLTTGSDALDKYWRFKKNFTIVNGHSNIGKTTFALYLQVVSSVLHGWKWTIYTSENRTASVKMKLMNFLTGKDLKTMTYKQRKAAYNWIRDHFTIISNDKVYSVYDILLFAEKIGLQQQMDGLFIDPYNGLRKDITNGNLGSHEYDYEAASEMLTTANAKGIAVWLNTHAVTEAQRMKGEDGLPIAPFAEMTEGGGKFVNRADDFLTFHRKIQHDDPIMRKTIEFHVRKIRETETGGEPTPLYEPIMFEMNGAKNTFYQGGKMLFDPSKILNESITLF